MAILNGIDYNCKIGDVVAFGNYLKGKNAEIGPIEWIVLAKENGRVLIISKDIIDSKPFNCTLFDITWEECTLRRWLNRTFMNNAFSNEEQRRILLSRIKPEKNPKYETYAGNLTEDQIFLLGLNEIQKYFLEPYERRCDATPYVKNYCLYDYDTPGFGFTWWLRTQGEDQKSVVYADESGRLYLGGDYIYNSQAGIRPAMWVAIV